MPTLRTILLFVTLLLASWQLSAKGYLYIQGDKNTPFYLKVNGVMQPRYSKHYCIAPDMATGAAKIEVLFQQNMYPPQTFTITMPENGKCGYTISRQNEGFVLYDLVTEKMIQPDKNTDK